MSNGDGQVVRAIEDAVTFPVLTEEVTYPTPSAGRTAVSGQPGRAPIGQVVDQAVRTVLGWKWKTGDNEGFLAALNQSFAGTYVEGHTEWTWTPKSYAAQVQADMGALTGAQASIYQRARVALDQSLPLLDGLLPLLPDADPEDVAAVRAIVRSEMIAVVTELGMIGGPRVPRIDDYFALLGGPPWSNGAGQTTNADSVQGNLGLLRDTFGLRTGHVNTVDEEQNLTNFLILVDYFDGLHTSWIAERPAFTGIAGGPRFLGTQLVLISRQLAVLSESIQQAYFAMDSVWLGPAERATIPILADGSIIYLGDLLQWAENFASDEGIRLLQDGGRQGIVAFRETLGRLLSLMDAALNLATTQGGQA